jgi:hypothetical protein
MIFAVANVGVSHASTGFPLAANGRTCASGPIIDQFQFSYTVPTDGNNSVFRLNIDPAGNLVFNGFGRTGGFSGPFSQSDCIALDGPNQVERIDFFRTADGFSQEFSLEPFNFTFLQNILPGATEILAGGPASFFNCNASGPIGELCGIRYDIFGNGTSLTIFASSVPEAEMWAMMIVGFGLVGFAARRRRKIFAI